MTENVVIIIASRMRSSRFPGKAMANICGQPMLERVIRRCWMTDLHVAVATSTNVENGVIESLCKDLGCPVFRGSEDDVLSRVYHCAVLQKATHVVRVTADCPLIDPDLILLVVNLMLTHPDVAYLSNTHPAYLYPRGLDVEAFTMRMLTLMHESATAPQEREHITKYVRDLLELFETLSVSSPGDFSHMNWCVDNPDDIEFPRRVYADLGNKFSWIDVLEYLRREGA